MKKVIGISGSLRSASKNTGLLRAFQKQAPTEVDFKVVGIDDLPLFNADLENNFPQSAQNLKTAIEDADAIIFAMPEYNRSVSGVLKNAIDWASRPYGQNSFNTKTVLVVGASPGGAGTMMAQYHLKASMLHLGAHVMADLEFMVGHAGDKFDEEGNLTDEKTKEFIDSAWEKLVNEL